MSTVAQIIVVLIVVAFFYKAISKNDKRFKGLRIALIGVMVGFSGALLTFSHISPFLSIIGYVTSLAAIIFLIVGSIKHSNIMFSSGYMESLDNRADYDCQDYESKYAVCPSCEKASIRLDATPAQCPLCKEQYAK